MVLPCVRLTVGVGADELTMTPMRNLSSIRLFRSSTLTGKFVHNHHTYENSVAKGCNAPSWRTLNEDKTMGAWMSKAGYKTGFFGICIYIERAL